MKMSTPGTQGNVLCTYSGKPAGTNLVRGARGQPIPIRAVLQQPTPPHAHLQNVTELPPPRPLLQLPQMYLHPKPGKNGVAPTEMTASFSAALDHTVSFRPKTKLPPNNFPRSSIGSVPLSLSQKEMLQSSKPPSDMLLLRSVNATTLLGCKILSHAIGEAVALSTGYR